MAFSQGEISKSRGFVQFVEQQKKTVPAESVLSSPPLEKSVSTEAEIAKGWDNFGESYLAAEPIMANQLTYLLMLHHLKKLRNDSPILSVGSGPGLYETYFAESMQYESLYSIDISHKLLQLQRKILLGNNGKQTYQPLPIEASMSAIPLPDQAFQQVWSINSIQWAPIWVKAIEEMSRVLSMAPGSQLLLVAASANKIKDGRLQPIAFGMNEDTIIDQLEKNELYLRTFAHLHIDRGQFGIPTIRSLIVAERGKKPTTHWSERLSKSPLISFIDYYIRGGTVLAENLKTRKNERVL